MEHIENEVHMVPGVEDAGSAEDGNDGEKNVLCKNAQDRDYLSPMGILDILSSKGNAEARKNFFVGDPERESCPVCLSKFTGQEFATPSTCRHKFCFDCIKEWSKIINSCPIDRKFFDFIKLRAIPDGSILDKVNVYLLREEPTEKATLPESVTTCEVCRSGDRQNRLLLCDGCNLAYHCECLDPPLFDVPLQEWFCSSCSGVSQNEAAAGPSHPRIRRHIARTVVSEAVRSRVLKIRTSDVPTRHYYCCERCALEAIASTL